MEKKRGLASIRSAFGEALVEIGEKRKDVVVVGADTTESLRISLFGKKFPDRLFNVGIAEQNMIGVAAGLALSGKTVFCGTYAMFLERAIDQIRNTIAYCNLNVKIVGSHAGLHAGPDGATHQALEDISIMRSLPNMRVIAPSDYYSTKVLAKQIAETKGPFYVRLVRADLPIIYENNEDIRIGKIETLKEGSDIAIIANGVLVSKALNAAAKLKEKGISTEVVDCHTIKPIDENEIVRLAKKTGRIITAEDHNTIGGLGSAVAEVLSRKYPIRLSLIGMKDVFGESGDSEELMKKHGLSEDAIVKEAVEMAK
jgi:transketolase